MIKMSDIKIPVFTPNDFRKWLEKNHDKHTKVALIIHKKHTGKISPSHREIMEEAICFGWIDTIVKRIDEDTFIRFFSRRNKNSKWSCNTLRYAKELIKNKRMTSHGLQFYKEGLKKLPHDHGIPKNPLIPVDLKRALDKNKTAKEKFNKLVPSVRKMNLRFILRAKMPETRSKRINDLVMKLKNEPKNFPLSI